MLHYTLLLVEDVEDLLHNNCLLLLRLGQPGAGRTRGHDRVGGHNLHIWTIGNSAKLRETVPSRLAGRLGSYWLQVQPSTALSAAVGVARTATAAVAAVAAIQLCRGGSKVIYFIACSAGAQGISRSSAVKTWRSCYSAEEQLVRSLKCPQRLSNAKSLSIPQWSQRRRADNSPWLRDK